MSIIKGYPEEAIDMELDSLTSDISYEIKNNPCIIDTGAFIEALNKNYKDFIQDNYRD